MLNALTHVTVVVKDQTEALVWYTEVFGLEKRTDRVAGNERWLSVGVPGQRWPEVVLQAPSVAAYGDATAAKKAAQVGHNPTWVFSVDDCRGTVESLRARGARIVKEPSVQPWGTSALVADLYGNLFTLMQPPA